MLKKFHSEKTNITKKSLFFLSRTPIHHSFTVDSRFLHELKRKAHLCKSVYDIFRIRFRLAFMKVYISA